jgi:hypothetical protein
MAHTTPEVYGSASSHPRFWFDVVQAEGLGDRALHIVDLPPELRPVARRDFSLP